MCGQWTLMTNAIAVTMRPGGIFPLIYQISKIFTEKFVLFEIGCTFDFGNFCFAQIFIVLLYFIFFICIEIV